MLRKTQIIELFRSIEKTRVSFFSVALFVFLATAIFLGISWSDSGFIDTLEYTLDQGKMEDVEIVYPYGLTEDLINDIREMDDVETAEGVYNAQAFFRYKGLKYQAKVISLTDEINVPVEIEGKLPTHMDEIAVDKHWAGMKGISIGDYIKLEDDGQSVKPLKEDSFLVTALVFSPLYINQYKVTYGSNGITGIPNDCILFVSPDAFNEYAYPGYSSVVVRSRSLRQYNSFDDIYDEKNKEFIREIERITEDYTDYRKAQIPEATRAYDCSILGRDANPGIGSAGVPLDIISKMKYTLSFLFVLVGLFVCYSAVSRIVYEQTKLIGTKKALGLNNRQITLSYLMYAAIAVLLGSAAAIMVARFLIEPGILMALALNYNVCESQYYFSASDSIWFFLFELVSTVLFAYMACRQVLGKRTIQLLNEENTQLGKRHWFEKTRLWKKQPLLIKTIVNNVFNDKNRVFATITGIIGCCSLMVSAVVLIVGIIYTKNYHLNEITTYDSMIYVDTTQPDAVDEIDRYLRSKGIKCAQSFFTNAYIEISDGHAGASIIVFDDDRFYDQFHIRVKGTEQTTINGVWLCKAYATFNGLQAGDKFEIIDSEGVSRELTVSGIMDYYLPRDQILMPADTYESLFDKDYSPNAIVFSRNEKGMEDLFFDLDKIDGFVSLFDVLEESETIFNAVVMSILAIAGVFIALSVVLAMAVVLNLLIMFVSEKKRELIVMMINGYGREAARKYIYSDTILLTIIGTILGAVLGIAVGFATLKMFDSDCVTMKLYLNIPSCVACMAATAILTGIAAGIALKKADGFKLRDINEM